MNLRNSIYDYEELKGKSSIHFSIDDIRQFGPNMIFMIIRSLELNLFDDDSYKELCRCIMRLSISNEKNNLYDENEFQDVKNKLEKLYENIRVIIEK